MDTVQGGRQHRTFARSNGLGGGPAVPHLVAAEERHRKNLQHIRQLKLSLCATVSSAGPLQPPSSRGASLPSPSSPSLPSPALPAWEAARDGSTGVVASRTPSALPAPLQPAAAAPHPGRETPISAAVLQSSQDEVEQLVREKHRLQRQCVELASLLANTHHDSGAPSALTVTHAATTGDSAAAWSPVHDAAVAVVAQVTRCYPDVVRDWAVATSGNGAAVPPGDTKRGPGDSSASSLATTTTVEITADELADSLRRLAGFLPQLASMTAVSELVTQAGPDMLDHIHVLEVEKQQDCVAVLSIADHLTSVSAQMRREAAEKDAALHALQQTVGDLLEEKQEWSRRARASEAALAERYTQYRQREKAWEREVNDLLHARDSIAAAALPPAVEETTVAATRAAEAAAAATAAEEREAALQRQLAQRQGALDTMAVSLRNLQEAHDTLQSTHATLQASSQASAAAQQERIAALEGQLHPLEAELQRQSETIGVTLRSVEELTDAHRAEVAALKEALRTTKEEREVALAELQGTKEGIEAELADVTASVAHRAAELQAMTAARDALQRALEEREQASVGDSSSFYVTASTPLRLTRVVDISADGGGEAADVSTMDSPSKLGEDEDGDNNEESTDALYRTTNVRKLQQSLKRMSRERAALKRKLEHRGAALAEMETELESAQRAVAQQEAHVQVLQADLESASATAAKAAAASAVVAVETPTTAAATQSAAPPQVTGSVTRIKVIDWIAFADLEEHEDEGSLYPTPVDLSEWLSPRQRGTERFADFVAHRLSAHDQLLVSAVGPLYHIGFNLLKAEGLLDNDLYFPVIWRRVLLQLQRVVDVQLEGLAVSVADCAHRFYTLASAAGLFKSLRESSDALTAYTLILAALSLCLGSRDGGEVEEKAGEGPSQQQRQQGGDALFLTQLPSAVRCGNNWAKWSCCQAVLRHVCDQGDGEADSSSSPQTPPSVGEGAATPYALLMLLAQQNGVANAFSPSGSGMSGFQKMEDGGSSKAGGLLGLSTAAAASSSSSPSPSPTPGFTLASLLSHSLLSDSLPRSHFALQMMMVQQFAQCTATRSVAEVTERGLHCAPSADCPTLVVLLLYIARYELLLEGGKVAEEGVPPLPSLTALGVRGAGEGGDAGEGTEALLLLLDTGLLPAIAMSMRLCRALEHEPHLLPTFFATRRAMLEKRQEVLFHGDWTATASVQAELLLGVPMLSEEQLRDCVQQVLQRVKSMPSTPGRVVQVPLVEYERLHCELLSLYQSNETYEAHLQQLLGAVESM